MSYWCCCCAEKGGLPYFSCSFFWLSSLISLFNSTLWHHPKNIIANSLLKLHKESTREIHYYTTAVTIIITKANFDTASCLKSCITNFTFFIVGCTNGWQVQKTIPHEERVGNCLIHSWMEKAGQCGKSHYQIFQDLRFVRLFWSHCAAAKIPNEETFFLF